MKSNSGAAWYIATNVIGLVAIVLSALAIHLSITDRQELMRVHGSTSALVDTLKNLNRTLEKDARTDR